MEITKLKCSIGNNCFSICNTNDCFSLPIMCNNQDCQCFQSHKHCQSNLRWKTLRELFSKKLFQTPETKKFQQQIEDLYKSVLKDIEKSYDETRNMIRVLGLNRYQRDIFFRIEQNRLNELNGHLINKIQIKSGEQRIMIKSTILECEKKQIKQQTQKLTRMLQIFTKQRFESKIIEDTSIIPTFFTRKINQLNLLYRSSQHNFQVDKFWERCNQKRNTLVVIKTQFGKIIGGYTPLAWNNTIDNWEKDHSKQSFIFSITNKHQLKLVIGRQGNAINHYGSYGPIFGAGCDIFISDKANENSNSCAKPGHTYNNGEYLIDDQQSYKKFSGQCDGSSFKINEWQVYEIVFD